MWHLPLLWIDFFYKNIPYLEFFFKENRTVCLRGRRLDSLKASIHDPILGSNLLSASHTRANPWVKELDPIFYPIIIANISRIATVHNTHKTKKNTQWIWCKRNEKFLQDYAIALPFPARANSFRKKERKKKAMYKSLQSKL